VAIRPINPATKKGMLDWQNRHEMLRISLHARNAASITRERSAYHHIVAVGNVAAGATIREFVILGILWYGIQPYSGNDACADKLNPCKRELGRITD